MLRHLINVSKWLNVGTTFILLIAAAAQALTFIFLARGLGANSFGRLMVMQAFSQLTIEFVSLGAGEALIRKVARNHEQHRSALGHALFMTTVTGIVLTACLSTIGGFIETNISIAAIFAYFLGELCGNRLINLSEHAFIGHSKIAFANSIRVISSVSKLGVVVVSIYFFGLNDLTNWLVIQGATTLLVGSICLTFLINRLGMPSASFHRSSLTFGALIATTQIAQSVQFSVDRIVLGMVAAPSIVAAYAAATRGVQVALIPISAILRNLFAKFFAHGKGGVKATRRFAWASFPKVITVGLLAGLALFVGADAFAAILGHGFSDTAPILRWLSLVAALQGIQYLLADTLTGADQQIWRTTINVVGSVGYIGAITVLGFLYETYGLISAIYLYQFGMIAAYSIAIKMLAAREPAVHAPVE